MLSEFGKSYQENLKDLYQNDGKLIKFLRDIAVENAREIDSIIYAIKSHLRLCPEPARIPCLYLVDCILKSDPPPIFFPKISAILYELFIFTWDRASASVRESLIKLCNLWTGIKQLDQNVVKMCLTHVQHYTAMQRRSATKYPTPPGGYTQYGDQVQYYRRDVPSETMPGPYQQFYSDGSTHVQYTHHVQPDPYAAAQIPISNYSRQIPENRSYINQSSYYSPASQQQQGYPQSYPQGYGPGPQSLPPAPQPQQQPQQQVFVQNYPAEAHQPPVQQQQYYSNSSSGGYAPPSYAPVQQQQQQHTQQQHHTQQQVIYAPMSAAPAPVPGMAPSQASIPLVQHQPSVQSQPVRSSLMVVPVAATAGVAGGPSVSPAGGSISSPRQPLAETATSAAAGRAEATKLQPPATAASPSSSASTVQLTTVFPLPAVLQELNSRSVQNLLEASQITKGKFLDATFARNKGQRGKLGISFRAWYPCSAEWLGATAELKREEVEHEEEEAQEEQSNIIEEDPSQPECAISGEPFEKFFDPDLDKWCYRDAVKLNGEQAEEYGVMPGSIVKVHCLDGKGHKRSEDWTETETGATDDYEVKRRKITSETQN